MSVKPVLLNTDIKIQKNTYSTDIGYLVSDLDTAQAQHSRGLGQITYQLSLWGNVNPKNDFRSKPEWKRSLNLSGCCCCWPRAQRSWLKYTARGLTICKHGGHFLILPTMKWLSLSLWVELFLFCWAYSWIGVWCEPHCTSNPKVTESFCHHHTSPLK